jgi:hypothetical protein
MKAVPGIILSSKDDFDFYCKSHQGVISKRLTYESELSSKEKVITAGFSPFNQAGTYFISDFTAPDADWIDNQIDDYDLCAAERLALHYAGAECKGIWGSALVIGDRSERFEALPGLDGVCAKDTDKLAEVVESSLVFDTVIYLGRISIDLILNDLRSLKKVVGVHGQVYISLKFDPGVLELTRPSDPHVAGWGVMKAIKDIGYAYAQIFHAWSKDFGYLGQNFVIEVML